jgi:hypothetical protein
MGVDVYISAGKDDAVQADWLCARLEENWLTCWVASRDRDPRLRYGEIDRHFVREAGLMIAVHSTAGDRRAVCIEERGHARFSAVPIVFVEAAAIPNSIDVDQLMTKIRRLLSFKLLIRIFIYSSRETEEECHTVTSLLGDVESALGKRARFELVFWNEFRTDRPSRLDIVVFLLREHLFTVLPWPGDVNAWMKVPMTTISGLLVYYKDIKEFRDRTANNRIQILAEETASANSAIGRWLFELDNELIKTRKFSKHFRISPPEFRRDFREYLQELAEESLRRAQVSKSQVSLDTSQDEWVLTLAPYNRRFLIPDRFRDEDRVLGRRSLTPAQALREAKSNILAKAGRTEPESVTKAEVLKRAHFSAFAPSAVSPGTEFILEVWACTQSRHEYEQVVQRALRQRNLSEVGTKQGVPVEKGTWLTVFVTIPALGIHPIKDRMYWDETIVNASFALRVPNDAPAGSYVGVARIEADSVPIALLHFQMAVDASLGEPGPLDSRERYIQSIFASYASEDRADVLQWARGAEAVGVEVFIDVVTLRAGDDWELELFRRVPSADLFSLFWSEPASKSKWVEMEWRCALAARGLDYIFPVSLVDPRIVAPPKELMSKHFNDIKRVLIEAEKGFSRQMNDQAGSHY